MDYFIVLNFLRAVCSVIPWPLPVTPTFPSRPSGEAKMLFFLSDTAAMLPLAFFLAPFVWKACQDACLLFTTASFCLSLNRPCDKTTQEEIGDVCYQATTDTVPQESMTKMRRRRRRHTMRPISSHLTTENMVPGRPAGRPAPAAPGNACCFWQTTYITCRRAVPVAPNTVHSLTPLHGLRQATADGYGLQRGRVSYDPTSYIPSQHIINFRHYNTESERAGGRENRGRQTQERVGSLTSSEHTYKQDLSVKKTKKHATSVVLSSV